MIPGGPANVRIASSHRGAAFNRPSLGWGPSTLQLELRSDLGDSTTALDLAATLSERYADWSPDGIERWDRIVPGAFVITFTYRDHPTVDS